MTPDIGSIIGKVWGTTVALHRSAVAELQFLSIKAGHRCSTHRHRAKKNLFFVVDGSIRVVVEKDGLKDSVVLGPGQMTQVRDGHWHSFEAIEDSRVIEFYWVELEAGDIERRDQGGPIPEEPERPAGRKSKRTPQ